MDWGRFENIAWLLFLILFIGLSLHFYRWRIKTKEKFADSNLINQIFPETSKNHFWLKVILVSLGILFLVIALMDPLFGEEEIKVKREGIDIVYALDLSNSMDAEDIAPSRLDKAKKIISESVERLGGDRVGLIVFAADAYVISPLTNDYSAIQSYINSAETDLISQQGTNFADVVLKSSELFEGAPTTGKLLVILSDGEDNESSISKAADLAKENNIHIASLGIGTKSGGPIPMNIGGFEEYKLDRYGETVISKLDESSMKSLAESSSGVYIRINQTQAGLEELHHYLNSLDKNVQDTAMSKDKKHIFQIFLALGLILIFIDTLTTEHKLFNNKKR